MLRLSQTKLTREGVIVLAAFSLQLFRDGAEKVAWTRQISVIGAELQIIDYFMQVVRILGCDINVHPATLSVIEVVECLVG